MHKSKLSITPEVLQSMVEKYNKLFTKWSKAKGSKRDAIGMEMEALNDKIIEGEKLLTKK